jgi:hypothetical protein
LSLTRVHTLLWRAWRCCACCCLMCVQSMSEKQDSRTAQDWAFEVLDVQHTGRLGRCTCGVAVAGAWCVPLRTQGRNRDRAAASGLCRAMQTHLISQQTRWCLSHGLCHLALAM